MRLLITNWYFSSSQTSADRYILSISGRWIIELSNAFLFYEPEAPITNILHGQQRIWAQFWLRSVLFSSERSSKFRVFALFYYITITISSFSGILSILFAALSQHLCYTDTALLHQMFFNISPSLALSAIFWTLSVNKLCTSLLKLCCDLYIIQI